MLTDDEIRDIESGLPEYWKDPVSGEVGTREELTAAGADPEGLIPAPIIKD
jgi:hypothetical protein